MCPEWQDDFMAFYNHIGPKPGPGYSLDRIDNDGNYEPGNVKWSTPEEQNNNKRSNAMLGDLTTAQYCRKQGINYGTFYKLHRTKGLSVEEATERAKNPNRVTSVMIGKINMTQYCQNKGIKYTSFQYLYRAKKLPLEEATRKAKKLEKNA